MFHGWPGMKRHTCFTLDTNKRTNLQYNQFDVHAWEKPAQISTTCGIIIVLLPSEESSAKLPRHHHLLFLRPAAHHTPVLIGPACKVGNRFLHWAKRYILVGTVAFPTCWGMGEIGITINISNSFQLSFKPRDKHSSHTVWLFLLPCAYNSQATFSCICKEVCSELWLTKRKSDVVTHSQQLCKHDCPITLPETILSHPTEEEEEGGRRRRRRRKGLRRRRSNRR